MPIDVETLYLKYGPMVLRRCRQLLRDEDKALDAMQDVFVLVLKKKGELKGLYPSSLLYTIATRVCLNRIRYRKRHFEMTGESVITNLASGEDLEKKQEARDLLERIFSGQKDSTRVMAWLHYVDGLTLEETAREVGLSLSGVRKRLASLKKTAGAFKGEKP